MQVGEHITVTGRVDEDWLEGSLQGRKGIFPASFIDHVPPGLSKVGAETKESSPVQQSGVNSKPAKVGVAQYKGVWQSTMECGTLHKGVWHSTHKGVWHSTHKGVWHSTHKGVWHTTHKGVWHSTKGCGTAQGGVAKYNGVWHSTAGTAW